jgi:hypothetical protein
MEFRYKLKIDYTDTKLKNVYKEYDKIYNIPNELVKYAKNLKFQGINVFEEISKIEIKKVEKKEKISKNEDSKNDKDKKDFKEEKE